MRNDDIDRDKETSEHMSNLE